MNYVVDFEGFFVKNSFIVKEFAYCRIEDSKSGQIILCPPYKWSELTRKEKRVVAYCEKHLHCIRWSCGLTPYKDFAKIVNEIISPFDTIYVKGFEKHKIVSSLLTNKADVINLEVYECPNIKKCFQGENSSCIFDQHIKNKHCAVLKVNRFATFLRSSVV